MLVERILLEARERLAMIGSDAPLIEAAKLLRIGTDIVLAYDPASRHVVARISYCQGASCVTPASLVMTRDVVTYRTGDC